MVELVVATENVWLEKPKICMYYPLQNTFARLCTGVSYIYSNDKS